MAPVILALQTEPEVEVRVFATAQHHQMLDQALNLFAICPEYDQDLMRPGQDLTDNTVQALIGMRDVLRQWRPDRVLVHGDTTTTSAAVLAAFTRRSRSATLRRDCALATSTPPGRRK